MESKEITVGKKTFKVHELLATEFDAIQEEENVTKRIIATIVKSADLTTEDYATLTLKERGAIQNAMAILNGWKTEDKDFQKPNVEKDIKE